MSGFRLKPPSLIGRKCAKARSVSGGGAVNNPQQRQPLPVRLSRILGCEPSSCFYMLILERCPRCGATHYFFLAGWGRGQDPREALREIMWMPCEEDEAFEAIQRGESPEETLGFPIYDADPARTRRILWADSLPETEPPAPTSDDEEPVWGMRVLFLFRKGQTAGSVSLRRYSQPEQGTAKAAKEGTCKVQ